MRESVRTLLIFPISIVTNSFTLSLGIEKHNKMLQEIQDKANFLLKPYHEYMGLEIQMAQKPEPSLRLLFSGTTPDKRCMVKISLKSMKSK